MPTPVIFSQFSNAPETDYIWFGTWMAQRRYLDACGKGIITCLRHVPGLRKRMIVALWNGARFNPSLRHIFPFSYDALQISADGYRARGFYVEDKRTVKTLFKNSRYGQNTAHEIKVRTQTLKHTDLHIPRILETEESADYIRLDEEFIAGRIFSHWRDTRHFEEQVSRPLQAVAEREGINHRPLCEVLDPVHVDVISKSASAHPKVVEAKAILAANPVVATCFTHGDLVSSNMIVSAGKVYLVDWERSAERYAGYDQARLHLKHAWNPDYARCAKNVFERHQGKKFTVEQAGTIRLAVAAAREAAKLAKN